MSALLANPASPLLLPDDHSTDERTTFTAGLFPVLSVDMFAVGGQAFVTDWWPAGDQDMGNTSGVMGAESWGGDPYHVSGANGRLAVVGYTRDAYGSPLGNVRVKLFRTLDDSLQATVTSDANGLYSVTSPYADGHYLVTYKAGPPDVCGTTVNTLAPS